MGSTRLASKAVRLNPRGVSRALLTVWLATVAAFYLAPTEFLGALAWDVLIAACFGSVLWGLRYHRPAKAAHWKFFMAGMTTYLVGAGVATAESAVGHSPTLDTGISDVLTLIGYGFMVAALIVLARYRTPQGDFADLVDALIIVGGIALALWITWIGPAAAADGLTSAERTMAILLPMFNLILLTLLLRLTFTPGPRLASYWFLIAAVASSLVAAQWNLISIQHHTYGPGHPLEIFRMAAYLFASLALVHPSMKDLARVVPGAREMLGEPRLFMFAAALLAGPVAVMVRLYSGKMEDPIALVAGSTILFFLMLLRIWTLLKNLRRRERNYRDLFDNTIEGVYETQRDGRFVRVNPSLSTLLGYTSPEHLLEEAKAQNHWANPRQREELFATLQREGSIENFEFEARTLDGREIWCSMNARAVFDEMGVISGIQGMISDITEQRQAVQALRSSEERFRSLVQNSSDAIIVADSSLTISYVSPALKMISGWDPGRLEGESIAGVFSPAEVTEIEVVAKMKAVGPFSNRLLACKMPKDDGTSADVEVVVTNLLDDPTVAGIVMNIRDVSERVALEEQLRHQAFHDSLTNLANRSLFLDRLTHALVRSERTAETCFVLFLDLDDFKRINDSQGHTVGDECLISTAKRLLAATRASDTVARMGGDEFAILIENAKLSDATTLAERILDRMGEPLALGGRRISLSPSIGIAGASSSEDPKEILRNADVAMYLAKRRQRGSYEIFDPEMYREVVRRIDTETELRSAIEEGQFVIHVQPIIELDSKGAVGAEVLLRWDHPERGLVYPGDFIEVAEETGLIVPIGNWVLHQACDLLASWTTPSTERLTLTVNLSARQLRDPRLVEHARRALAGSGADPSRLVLEITESVMAENIDQTIVRLNELKSLGVKLAIDDFGTGYSSLSYLQNFPIDVLKIDRSFVSQLEGQEGASLAQAIVRIGESLSLTAVGEGIETQGQADALMQLGCQYGQGFLYAKPMPLDELTKYLDRWHSGPHLEVVV